VQASAAVVRSTVGAAAPSAGFSYVSYASSGGQQHVLALRHAPLRVELYTLGVSAVGVPSIVVNDRGLLYFEHRRARPGSAEAVAGGVGGAAGTGGRKIVGWWEDGKPRFEDGTAGEVEDGGATPEASVDGLWEENFQSHHDTKPKGPTSIGIDIVFPAATHVYGLPEHASSHALKATDGSERGTMSASGNEYREPYRLYNLDVFEYELDNSMALYGSIPVLMAHGPGASKAGHTAGVFWNNPTETYVDIANNREGGGVGSRWVSESGVVDLWLLPGPGPKDVVSSFTNVVGTQGLPPMFALGYHQCRWNYRDEADVYDVDAKFEENAFPYDVLWLDIEHTDGKKYFTWNKALFPNPTLMQDRLAARGHKMVTIIDPHIKRDAGYPLHTEAQSKALYVRNKDGGEFEGWCWPGSSSYLDFTSPATRSFWADQFSVAKYEGSTQSLYTWNDMNEPSVFNGPEVSMAKDALSIAGVEHREWHNLYGFYQTMATAEGQLRRTPDRNARTFVLSRAFYAGTQRYGAIWTGDNEAKWEHLAAAAPMLLTVGVAGLTFSGADVGGFFHNPTTELMIRWYQAGAFQPFFRAHAHIDTARREPWLFGDDTLNALRDIVRTRYSYLPLWYTLFAEANATGVPTMRPMWMEFPGEGAVYGLDGQWMVGADLLVKPVVTAGALSVPVYFPGGKGATWYDAVTFAKRSGEGEAVVAAPLSSFPVFQRGGAIVPRQMRVRRASQFMRDDPYTLIVTLDAGKRAAGRLYLDDGATYDFARKGLFRTRAFAYAPEGAAQVLRSTLAAGNKAFVPSNTVERVVIAGVGNAPASVTAVDADGTSRPVSFIYETATDVLTLRKPDVKVAYDWTIILTF